MLPCKVLRGWWRPGRLRKRLQQPLLLLAVCGGACVKHVCACYVCVLGYVDGRLLTRGASGEAPVLKDMVVVSQWGSYRVVGGRFQ